MEESRTFNSIRNIMAGFLGQGISMLISFVNRIIFVQTLSQAYLGVNGLFTNILSVLSLAELGISSAITYALYKPLAQKNTKKISILMNFYAKAYRLIGILIGIIGICLMPFLKYIIADPGNINENLHLIYCLFLFNTVITYFYSYKSSLIIADQKNYLVSSISYASLLVQTLAQIFVLIVTKNYILYLICQSLGNILTNILISREANKRYPFLKEKNIEKLEVEDKKSLFVNIKALFITKIAGVLVNSTDNIIISATKGLGLVSSGIASNYTLLTSTLTSILAQVFNGLTASIGNLNAIENENTKVKYFNIINFMNFWLYGWCTVSFIIVGSDIVELLFGYDYVLAFPIVVIMAINFYTVGMQNAVWTYKSTLGLFNYGKYLTFLTGLVNIFLSILLAQYCGLFGIFLATFISRLMTNIWYDPYAVCNYGLKISFITYVLKYLRYALVLLITFGLIYGVNYLLSFGFVLKLMMCIFIPHIIFYISFRNTYELNFFIEKLNFVLAKFHK